MTIPLLYWHRLIALVGAVLLLFVVVTGTGIQLSDMRALVFHAPETDPDMLMMRQHIDGAAGFAVISAPDYTARQLPAGMDDAALLEETAALGRSAIPDAPMTLVEVRTVDGGEVAGRVRLGSRDAMFDLATKARLPNAAIPQVMETDAPNSARLMFKKLHQFRFLGPLGSIWSGLAGPLLGGLLITGLVQYYRAYRSRAANGRKGMIWRAGGLWRDLHRATSVCAGLVVIWIVSTGLVLSVDDIGGGLHRLAKSSGSHTAQGGPPNPDVASPLKESEFAAMTRVTLDAFHKAMPGQPLKVLQLRDYAGYPQGIVIAGDGAHTRQLVFNARTGAAMSMQERGYPDFGFLSGWQWHQTLKRLHRGDFFGMTGRWLMTLGALSLLYLVISGPVMYWQLWNKRRQRGRAALVWR